MTAPSALPGLDAIRDLCTDLGEDEHFGIRVSRARALVAAVEAAAEVEASAEPYYVVGRGGHGKRAVRVDKAALVHLRTALSHFTQVPAPPVSHTDAVWQEGDDRGGTHPCGFCPVGGTDESLIGCPCNQHDERCLCRGGDEAWDGDEG